MQNTPMSRVKDSINTFEKLLSPAFKGYRLQKKEAKYDPYGGYHGFGGESKGVESDFIYIFKSTYGAEDLVPSIAIVVDYIDRDLEQSQFTMTKQMVVRDHYRRYHSSKELNNGEIIHGATFTLEEFKSQMRILNKKLKTLFDGESVEPHLKWEAILHIWDENFFNQPELVIDKEKVEEGLKEVLKDPTKAREAVEKKIEELDHELVSRKTKINNSIARCKPQKELRDLIMQRREIEKMIKEREDQVAERRKELHVKHDIQGVKAQIEQEKEKLKDAEAAESRAKVAFFIENKVTKSLQNKLEDKPKNKRR